MTKDLQPLSIEQEDIHDVQLEGGDAPMDRSQTFFCQGCCYAIWPSLFGGLIGANFIQFIVFAVIEPGLVIYFFGMLIIWGLGFLLYCIAGCCKADGFVRFLDPTCGLVTLAFNIYGAVILFGNPVLSYVAGVSPEINISELPPYRRAAYEAFGKRNAGSALSSFSSATTSAVQQAAEYAAQC